MEKPWYMFMPDYFMDDLWNTVDVACLVINGFVINSIFRRPMVPAGSPKGLRAAIEWQDFPTVRWCGGYLSTCLSAG